MADVTELRDDQGPRSTPSAADLVLLRLRTAEAEARHWRELAGELALAVVNLRGGERRHALSCAYPTTLGGSSCDCGCQALLDYERTEALREAP